MCHTISNLEHHHFKYPQFRRPGDLHVHFFGTATLSFADGVRSLEGDEFEIEAPAFGRPLRNSLHFVREEGHVAIEVALDREKPYRNRGPNPSSPDRVFPWWPIFAVPRTASSLISIPGPGLVGMST